MSPPAVRYRAINAAARVTTAGDETCCQSEVNGRLMRVAEAGEPASAFSSFQSCTKPAPPSPCRPALGAL